MRRSDSDGIASRGSGLTRDELLAGLTTSLRDLTAWLTDRGIPHVIIGGVAVALRGNARLTQDIDAVILAGGTDPKDLLADARSYRLTPRRPDAADFAAAHRVLLLQHEVDGTGIDISLGMLPFEEEMINRATRLEVQGVEIPVATSEDLILMKALAFRGKDVADIESILDAGEPIDLKRVRHWVRLMADALDDPEIAERLERLLAKRPPTGPGKKRRRNSS